MAYEKKAVHFGGGNIGRGFVAEFLHKSGYEVVFVDVMESIIDALQANKHYTVTEIGEDGEHSFDIDHYRAINSRKEMPKVIEEIATADVVTCAVGPNVLKFVAEPVAKGIAARKLDYPLAVIACENMIGATTTWKGFIEQHISELGDKSILDKLDTKARFANSAIDRIVPHQDPDAGLNVKIEKFYEWCVEKHPFDGAKIPAIDGVHFVGDLEPYIERKLFTVNTSHATAAYYGYARGKATIHDAMTDPAIHDIVRDTLKETAHLITNKHEITTEEQDDYVEKIVARISNPALEDKVERVGRAPLRKMSRNERFIAPAAHLAEMGSTYNHLLGAFEQALKFVNVEGDDESFELAKILKEKSAKEATLKITGLEETHKLFADVEKVIAKVQKSSSL
ncbi:uncharacterized protein BDZ99DRAFT_466462 [Mytilinidion resinicola]|uniref:Mannitol-1-phosphate 5-dehydrogenase n=1 Tax=Mytilinidion resinicola TaxID=574789 RepID=A0A6A6Y9H5_9PEZI|nr:uncharacterized protein BDZ99DRAFT_466462 [Mytilinidion resinicola]KAF2805472.1 hypothetical protein BDZ99DRAFT_466462 [Mytilinidion resinicola]